MHEDSRDIHFDPCKKNYDILLGAPSMRFRYYKHVPFDRKFYLSNIAQLGLYVLLHEQQRYTTPTVIGTNGGGLSIVKSTVGAPLCYLIFFFIRL